MIKLKTSIAGTDIDGKPFSCRPGETVALDAKSEANYIAAGLAEKVIATKKKAAR